MIPALRLFCALTILSITAGTAHAFDLNGPWASDGSDCTKLFSRLGSADVAIKADADLYGDSFIVRGSKIVGKTGTCEIRSRKHDAGITHLVAFCAAENVAMSTFQFSYRTIDADHIVRIFPGLPELDSKYHRCK